MCQYNLKEKGSTKVTFRAGGGGYSFPLAHFVDFNQAKVSGIMSGFYLADLSRVFPVDLPRNHWS